MPDSYRIEQLERRVAQIEKPVDDKVAELIRAARECVATGQRDWLTAEWSYLVKAVKALDEGARQ